MAVSRIYLMFKSHFDIGFTMLAEEIVRYYAGDMLDRVFDTCDATKDMGSLRYVWTMPAWPLQKIRGMITGKRREKLDQLIRSGQISWHALPFTSHYDACGVEDAIRGLRYARELSDEFGEPMHTAAKLTDVPGQGRLVPEILAGAGIEFLHIGVNDFATPPDVPRLFRWQTPSGKSIVTMLGSGYGTGLLPPDDWPYPTWIAILSTEDNSGPQSAEMVAGMVRKIRRQYPEAEICCASLEAAWKALREEDLSGLPVVTQDLADTWIHGIASYPEETARIRRVRSRLNRAECAMLQAPRDVCRTADAQIRKAYAAVNMYTEHTWGLDVKTWLGKLPDYDAFEEYRATSAACARMEASWDEQRKRARDAEAFCTQAEETLGIREAGDGMRDAWDPLAGEQTLENRKWRVCLDADTGRIHSVTDKQRCAVVLRETKDHAAIFYRHEVYGAEEMTEYLRRYAFRFYDWGIADNGRMNYPAFCRHRTGVPVFLGCEKSGDRVRLRYAGNAQAGDAKYITLILDLSGDRLRVHAELEGKKATPYVESGELCFEFVADAPRYLLGRPGSVLRPETEIAPGANHAFYAIESFAAVEDQGIVTAIVSPDAPLVSIGENGVYAFRRTYEAHAPQLHMNLYNNMWGTNFPQWIEGSFRFEFELITGRSADEVSIRACESTEGVQKLLSLPDGLRIAGVLAEEDGFLVHIRNMTSQRVRFEAPHDMSQTDLLGREVTPQAEVQPYEVCAYRLRTGKDTEAVNHT